jgi:LuxR family quorum-sensing system transcriptional regulator CciR
MREQWVMPALSVVEDFIAAAESTASMPDLNALAVDAVGALGFDFFGIVHHVRFGVPDQGHVHLYLYPEEWIAEIRDMGRPPDPVFRAAEQTACGFRWDRLNRIIRPTPRERRHLDQAARHGVGNGFTVPNHVPGEAPGSSNFGCRSDRELPERNLAAAQALGNFAFEAARRLNRAGHPSWIPPVALSERQRDCLLLAAQGKSDGVIAQLLGLKPRTVNEHMEAAKRRYGVATRAQLVVQALLRSEITFGEALGAPPVITGMAPGPAAPHSSTRS